MKDPVIMDLVSHEPKEWKASLGDGLPKKIKHMLGKVEDPCAALEGHYEKMWRMHKAHTG
eukprot:1142154-Alexandrium_andersonii.AAC.1